jgi:hypothetical protein
MNLHIAQTQGARVECSTISRTAFQLISAQNCAPVMGCVQNTLVCNYILTETFTTPGDTDADSEPNYELIGADGASLDGYQTLIDRDDFMAAIETAKIPLERIEDLISRAAEVYPEYIRKGKTLKRKIPGKLAVSIVFPRNFTWQRKTDVNPLLPVVKIVKGVILPDSGPICKKTIGGCGGSAIHALWKMSPDLSMRLITELQFMTTVFISRIGFSIGISDCLPTEDELIHSTIHEALIKCEMINDSEKDKDEKEMEIVGALNGAMGIAPVLARTKMNKGDRNALVIMKKSGAKGSDTNNGQISAFVGSQCIDGKRMPYMLSDGKRALPHFFVGDNSPQARGFVKNSYLDGLTYQETWFHAAAGRRGVVDTAMKSVVANTKIMIDIGGQYLSGGPVKVIEIGPWIDNLLLKCSEQVKILGIDQDMELLDLRDIGSVFIPTVDTRGDVSWGTITHVTRHSPTAILYRIKTKYGREVVVTDSKSLLVWNFLYSRVDQVQATTVKVGNFVPVTMKLPKPSCGVLNDGVSPTSPPEIKLALFNRKGIFCLIEGDSITPLLPKDLMIKGDIVLDEIISIDRLPGDEHRYVYDLTVPSTTNFCLANGLHVVDTADWRNRVGSC